MLAGITLSDWESCLVSLSLLLSIFKLVVEPRELEDGLFILFSTAAPVGLATRVPFEEDDCRFSSDILLPPMLAFKLDVELRELEGRFSMLCSTSVSVVFLKTDFGGVDALVPFMFVLEFAVELREQAGFFSILYCLQISAGCRQ